MDLLLVEKALMGLFYAVAVAVVLSRIRGKRFKLPPGPTGLPIIGSLLHLGSKLDHRVLSGYAKEFGDIVLIRMGQLNVVSVSSKELAKEVLITQGVEFGSRSRDMFFDILTGHGQDLIFSDYGDHWRKMRRIVTVPFFTNKVVQRHSSGWEAEAAAVVEDVRKHPEAATNGVVLRKRLQLMVHNNVYKLMFDRRFESGQDPLFVKVMDTNKEIRSILGDGLYYNLADFMPLLRPTFLKGYVNKCKKVAATRLNLYKDCFVAQREKLISSNGIEIKDVKCATDYFLQAKEKGEISDDKILYILENMNIAAIKTTIWTLEWAIAELTNNPNVQKKLREEIDTKLGKGVQVTESDTHRLPYLQAVIKEILRLRMVVPCLLPHTNLHAGKLGGYDIPSHSRILVNAWELANDPKTWKKPEEFRPERFLEEECNVEASGNDLKYIPFGVGRRSCPGILIAMSVLGITLGRLVQNFEMSPPPGQSKIDVTENNVHFALRILKHSTIVLKKPISD